ncbi:MAG: prepilin-type N-terminal cleavage/methylation domain-containing protein [Verrucomicrobiota bacterium]
MCVKPRTLQSGFSLMEVLLAIAIVSISMIPLVGLIPIGLKKAQLSTEETHAVHYLSAVIQDLRYPPPGATRSEVFKLSPLPYNGAVVHDKNRVWVDSCWSVYPEDQKPNVFCYQIEWEYTQVPEPASFLPVEANITVRWPPKPNPSPDDNLTSKTGGEVTSHASFRKP